MKTVKTPEEYINSYRPWSNNAGSMTNRTVFIMQIFRHLKDISYFDIFQAISMHYYIF